ncbi:MAG: ABC transporter permease subunit [Candidatus Latescibacteria bacterium]|nr:ABC transporter permease subunit [Candidatus Latescibacterota bacterium]NIO27293.1 ABC transporter permease subunit [Candidatus Latescibacterota bacterium]NIO54817.1 ABC transporter permease subunit [Candidatus Latescibacterota bacterium]NIT00900.1 ABC transporter permease subunit [Candidatus Latescibacterota bacterium]NIT37823.1 ABC transporter permease subunit [Candidatus Latescibacterota bacterium]
MLHYTIKRILLFLPILLGVATITFFLLYILPGDPVLSMVGERYDEETIQKLREEMHLDKSVGVQYAHFLKKLAKLDFGRSYVTGEPVWDSIWKRFPYTFRLAVAAMAISVVLGISAGVLAAWKWGGTVDHVAMGVSIVGISMPVFWLGVLLIYLFSIKLHLLPPSGYGGGSPAYLILPAFTLAQASAAYVARITRSSMLDEVREYYIQAARAKGVPERKVLVKHALRNALLPIITVVGTDFGSFLSGAVLTESIFAWPGLGRFTLDAILKRDIPAIQGAVFFMAVVFMVINLAVDLSYAWVDPRIRTGRRSGSE